MNRIPIIIALMMVALQANADSVKIRKSQVAPTFATDVATYAQELAAWKNHMARVDADKKAGVPREKAFAPYPSPIADPAVVAVIGPDGKPNFQIVDDGPTPDQVLASKKEALITAVRISEKEAILRIVPPGKRRALDYRQNDVSADDKARSAVLLAAQPVGVLSKLGIGAQKDPAKADIDAIAQRRPDDAKFMADQADRRARITAIEHAAAQMESDVEDLTAANIDGWTMPAFPN